MDELKELLDKAQVRSYIGPTMTSKALIKLELMCDFEIGGAHESWGTEWALTMPTLPNVRQTHKGWVEYDSPRKFSATTPEGCIRLALQYVDFLIENDKMDKTPVWLRSVEPGSDIERVIMAGDDEAF